MQLNTIYKAIDQIDDQHILNLIRDKLDQASARIYDRKENFMYHDKIDNYIYRVKDRNGQVIYAHYLGSNAYEWYMNRDEAYEIERHTKDLFPEFETLLTKNTTDFS